MPVLTIEPFNVFRTGLFLLVLTLASLIGVANAAGTPIACQTVATGGMNWEGAGWKPKRYADRKFILVLDGGVLTTESAMKAMDALSTECQLLRGTHSICYSRTGDFMLFNAATLNGGIAMLLGATQATNAQSKDSVTVETFSCSNF